MGSVFIENSRRLGGVSQQRGGGRGAGRVSAGILGGGWAKYFFWGRDSHQVNITHYFADLSLIRIHF